MNTIDHTFQIERVERGSNCYGDTIFDVVLTCECGCWTTSRGGFERDLPAQESALIAGHARHLKKVATLEATRAAGADADRGPGRAPIGECDTCDATPTGALPRHDASPRCESGGRHHCTCPICWG